ncbi:hypothetical protein D3C78_1698630 [compost metagenome]
MAIALRAKYDQRQRAFDNGQNAVACSVEDHKGSRCWRAHCCEKHRADRMHQSGDACGQQWVDMPKDAELQYPGTDLGRTYQRSDRDGYRQSRSPSHQELR